MESGYLSHVQPTPLRAELIELRTQKYTYTHE